MCIVPVQLPQLLIVLNDFSAVTPGASADTAALRVLQHIEALLADKLVKLLNIPMKILCVICIGFNPPTSTGPHSERCGYTWWHIWRR